MHYFSCSGGLGVVFVKSATGYFTLNLFFASGGIYGSCSAFLRIRGVKRRRTIFHAQVGSM
jgi:hypothetical protein